MNTTPQQQSSGELRDALGALAPIFRRSLLFSAAIGLLMLAPSIYMLQVYDRVVNSRSGETLAMLTLLILGAYVLMEFFEWVRRETLGAAGDRLNEQLATRIFSSVFQANLKQMQVGGPTVFSDFNTLRTFVSGPAVLAALDSPASLLFLLIVFVISPWLGLLALGVAVIQLLLTLLTERLTRTPLEEGTKAAAVARNYANATLHNAEVVHAMGMAPRLHDRWMQFQERHLALQADASRKAGATTASGKFFQLLQASAMLGLAAWLSMQNMLVGGPGMMMVAVIVAGRATAPLVQLISAWKTVPVARLAYQRLDKLLTTLPASKPGMPLPVPVGTLTVEGVTAVAPGSSHPILRQVAFGVAAGTVLGVIGPSASGKSTLARLLVGVWTPAAGRVRLDGVDVAQWNKTELGPHVGYLPQDVELFDGTLAENIARFGEVDMDKVRDAARRAGLEAWVGTLENGFDTRVGDEGEALSGGQRQRVALARAIYGRPRLLVLDEPNASLDEEGERALVQSLLQLKAEGATIVVITHRTGILAAVDQLLLLKDGTVAKMGPRDEVFAALGAKPVQAAGPAAGQA